MEGREPFQKMLDCAGEMNKIMDVETVKAAFDGSE
jgi:hypothetical protein